MLGRYLFSVPEAISRGELRPLGRANDGWAGLKSVRCSIVPRTPGCPRRKWYDPSDRVDPLLRARPWRILLLS